MKKRLKKILSVLLMVGTVMAGLQHVGEDKEEKGGKQ